MTGKPTLGEPVPLTSDEFFNQSRQFRRGCYGVFDTAKIDHTQSGRTYHEVLTKISCGEFAIIGLSQTCWVSCNKYGVRPLVFIQWSETMNSTPSQTRKDSTASEALR